MAFGRTLSCQAMGYVDDVVSEIVKRAAQGGSSKLSDQEIEKYIAELILKESQESEKKYAREGVSAYLDPERRSRLPKPNTRFLASVVKSTHSHNKALLEQLQEDARSKLKTLQKTETPERKRKSHELDTQRDPDRDRRRPRSEDDTRRRRDRGDNYSPNRRDATEEDKSTRRGRDTYEEDTRKRRRVEAEPEAEKVLECIVPKATSEDSPPAEPKTFRGRGSVGPVRLDQLFTEGYNPRLDFDNYDDSSLHHYVEALQELNPKATASKEKKSKKEKKKHKKKKKKKKKEKDGVESVNEMEDAASDTSESSTTFGPVYEGPRVDLSAQCPW
ncbi:hypothetical protein HDU96_003329 [Phlyctochytrium bullatum]|nr:hypothetical protein HDU96_003329 [Phlyctochytrium bullatum]